jgi:hypothetical protein
MWGRFKKTVKSNVVGSIDFMLRQYMKLEYTDLVLPDNTTGWKQGWFYHNNSASALHNRTRRAPVPFLEWTNQLTSWETEELRPLLEDLERLKAES